MIVPFTDSLYFFVSFRELVFLISISLQEVLRYDLYVLRGNVNFRSQPEFVHAKGMVGYLRTSHRYSPFYDIFLGMHLSAQIGLLKDIFYDCLEDRRTTTIT